MEFFSYLCCTSENRKVKMRLKYLFNEYKKNWLIATIGIVLYAFGFAILSINEGSKAKKV